LVELCRRRLSAAVAEDSTGCTDCRKCNRNPWKILHAANSFHSSQRCVRAILLCNQVTRQSPPLVQSFSSVILVHGTPVNPAQSKSRSMPDLFWRPTVLVDRN